VAVQGGGRASHSSSSREWLRAVTSREIRSLVKRIVDKFGPAVIDYKEFFGTSLPMDPALVEGQ
jgi:hypothetical protein